MWITWGTDTAHLLPRLIAGRERGPLFLSEYRPGPHRLAITDPRDICPGTGRARLGYDRARILLARYADVGEADPRPHREYLRKAPAHPGQTRSLDRVTCLLGPPLNGEAAGAGTNSVRGRDARHVPRLRTGDAARTEDAESHSSCRKACREDCPARQVRELRFLRYRVQ